MCNNKKKKVTKLVWEIQLAQVTHCDFIYQARDKFVPSVHATFRKKRKHSFDVILKITKQVYCIVQKESYNVCFMAQAHVPKRH